MRIKPTWVVQNSDWLDKRYERHVCQFCSIYYSRKNATICSAVFRLREHYYNKLVTDILKEYIYWTYLSELMSINRSVEEKENNDLALNLIVVLNAAHFCQWRTLRLLMCNLQLRLYVIVLCARQPAYIYRLHRLAILRPKAEEPRIRVKHTQSSARPRRQWRSVHAVSHVGTVLANKQDDFKTSLDCMCKRHWQRAVQTNTQQQLAQKSSNSAIWGDSFITYAQIPAFQTHPTPCTHKLWRHYDNNT